MLIFKRFLPFVQPYLSRMLLAGLLVMGVIAAVWLALRQEETLPKEKRAPLSLAALMAAGRETVTTPVTMAYTLGTGCVFGSFVCYLGTAQQIFVEQYDQGAYFPLWFGCFAVAIAISMILNGRFVMKLGMRRISNRQAWRCARAGRASTSASRSPSRRVPASSLTPCTAIFAITPAS